MYAPRYLPYLYKASSEESTYLQIPAYSAKGMSVQVEEAKTIIGTARYLSVLLPVPLFNDST